MRKLRKTLQRYNLSMARTITVDLRTCYMQQRPNSPIDDLLMHDGKVDSHLYNSPHYEIAKLYLDKGRKGVLRQYKKTRYYEMCRRFGKKGFPEKVIRLTESLRKGYLKDDHKNSYIVVLNEPFANSRFNRNVPSLIPEMWSGHHRGSILLALDQNIIDAVEAVDNMPGSNRSAGKIHQLCRLA